MRLFTMRSRICAGSELIASSAMFSYSSTSLFVPLVSVFPWKAVFRSVISRVEGPCYARLVERNDAKEGIGGIEHSRRVERGVSPYH